VRPACTGHETALADRAAGILPPVELARLERHLDACPACRAEADALEQALRLAALPPPSAGELSALASGAREALLRERTTTRERRFARRMALAVAASAAFAVAVPWYLLSRHAPTAEPAAAPVAADVAGREWDLPDLEAAWAASAAVDPAAPADDEPEVLFAELQEVDLDPD
jgi:anti-sigma factor RsiW